MLWQLRVGLKPHLGLRVRRNETTNALGVETIIDVINETTTCVAEQDNETWQRPPANTERALVGEQSRRIAKKDADN